MRRLSYLLCLCLLIGLPPIYAQQSTLPEIDPSLYDGQITIAGSDALIPLVDIVYQLFEADGFAGSATITPAPTATAIEQFCNGELAIALADRPLTQTESSRCRANGRAPVVFRMASTGVTIAASPDNTFLTNLTIAELQQAFGDELNWVGIRPDFPAEPIARVGTARNSVTYNVFASALFGETRPLDTAVNAQYLDDPQTAVDTLRATPNAIGFFDSAFIQRTDPDLKIITINNSEPSYVNVANGTYALSRPMLLYTAPDVMQEQEQVAAFINYYIANAQLQALGSGLFPVAESTQQVAINTWVNIAPDPRQDPSSITPSPTATATTTPTPAPATTVPTPDVNQTVGAFDGDVATILLNARTDINTLADAIANTRPEGYAGTINIDDAQTPLVLRFDLELLAETEYGDGNRPRNWFGAVPGTPFTIARDIRHDLELLANAVYGSQTTRPNNWNLTDPLYRCNRSTQALVNLLVRNDLFTVSVPANSPTYCADVETAVARFTEINLLNTETLTLNAGQGGGGIAGDIRVDTEIAVAFFDTRATRRAGVVPFDTPLEPIARSTRDFSRMVLFDGGSFTLFLDYRNTTLSQDAFRNLPGVDTLESVETQCSAFWCE